MADVNEYLAHFSQELCQEIKDYATNVALVNSRYIFVDTKGKQQYGYCTHCNKEFKTHIPKPSKRELAELEMCGCPAAMISKEDWEKKRQGNKMKCPSCGSECTVKHVNRGYKNLYDFAYFTFYEKSILDPKIIVARFIGVERDYRNSHKNVETRYWVEAHYVFEYKKGAKQIKRMYSYQNGYHEGFARKIHSMASSHSYSRVSYSEESIANAVKDTPFAWSGWERYSGYFGDKVEFFDLFARYPMTEYLTKLGYRKLIVDKLQKAPTFSAINWRGKDILKVFKLTKEELNTIRQQNIDVTYWFLHLIKLNKEKNLGLSLLDLGEFSESFYGEGEIDTLKSMCLLGMTFRDVFKYVKKQYSKNRRAFYSVSNVVNDWFNYKSECKELGFNLKDKNVLFPSDLHKAHQNTTSQIKYKKDSALNNKILERLPELEYLKFSNKTLLIRPAESTTELINEGKALNHCVGRYAEDYAKGKTNILFVRKIKEPDKSFYTLELKDNKIIQCRGKCNDNYTNNKSVKAFVEEFESKKLKKKPEKARVKITA